MRVIRFLLLVVVMMLVVVSAKKNKKKDKKRKKKEDPKDCEGVCSVNVCSPPAFTAVCISNTNFLA